MGFEDATTPAADAIYRSIVYTKAALLQGAVYERPTPASIEDPTKMTFTEKKLSPVADGGGSAQAANDAHSTSQLVVADMQRQGNLDIIYASDKNEPARVSYARPPADPTPVAAETSDLQMEADAYRADVLAGMLAFINNALADTPPANLVTVPTGLNAEGVTQGRIAPHAETGEEKYPQSYAATLTNGDTPTNAIVADDGAETHPQYQDPEGNLVSVAGAGADVGTCRAPAEDVVPLTLSLQIDFPVVVSKLPQPLTPRAHAHAHDTHHDCLPPPPLLCAAVRRPALPRLHPARPALRERPSAAHARRRHGAHLRHRAAQGLSPRIRSLPVAAALAAALAPSALAAAAQPPAFAAAAFAAAALAAAKSSPVAAAKSSPVAAAAFAPAAFSPAAFAAAALAAAALAAPWRLLPPERHQRDAGGRHLRQRALRIARVGGPGAQALRPGHLRVQRFLEPPSHTSPCTTQMPTLRARSPLLRRVADARLAFADPARRRGALPEEPRTTRAAATPCPRARRTTTRAS